MRVSLWRFFVAFTQFAVVLGLTMNHAALGLLGVAVFAALRARSLRSPDARYFAWLIFFGVISCCAGWLLIDALWQSMMPFFIGGMLVVNGFIFAGGGLIAWIASCCQASTPESKSPAIDAGPARAIRRWLLLATVIATMTTCTRSCVLEHRVNNIHHFIKAGMTRDQVIWILASPDWEETSPSGQRTMGYSRWSGWDPVRVCFDQRERVEYVGF